MKSEVQEQFRFANDFYQCPRRVNSTTTDRGSGPCIFQDAGAFPYIEGVKYA